MTATGDAGEYNVIVTFKDGSYFALVVTDKAPVTTAHNLLVWTDVNGWRHMVNASEVQFECTPVGEYVVAAPIQLSLFEVAS